MRAHVAFLQIINPIDDGSASSPSNAVVVRFTDSPYRRDVGLYKETLRQVRDAFFRNDEIGLARQNSVTHMLNLLLLNLQNPIPIILLTNLNIRLRLPLLILQRTIQQHNPWILNPAPHLGVRDVLIQHDAVDDLGALDLAAGELLDARVALDVDFLAAGADVVGHRAHGLQGEAAHEVRPARDEFGADTGGEEGGHCFVGGCVDGEGDFGDDGQGVGEGAFEGGDYGDGVDVAFELGEGAGEDFAGWEV